MALHRPNPRLFMRHLFAAIAIALALPAAAHAHQDANAPAGEAIAEAAQPAVAVVDEFSAALKAGDLARVGALLADDVLVLESGGAERSKEEYFASHAAADAEFLRDAHVMVTRRTARVVGDVAWVGTESEMHTSKSGVPLTMLSTETMVLARTSDGWRIVHIHWSSRKKEQASP
ncbi:MAG: YybH family protein [Arenimonas sp.]